MAAEGSRMLMIGFNLCSFDGKDQFWAIADCNITIKIQLQEVGASINMGKCKVVRGYEPDRWTDGLVPEDARLHTNQRLDKTCR